MSTILSGPVDENGNIGFNRNASIIIPVTEKDGNGDPVDISELPRYIILNNGALKKSLGPDPDVATGRRILLTVLELGIINNTGSFVITDESDPSMPTSLWEGIIYERTYA